MKKSILLFCSAISFWAAAQAPNFDWVKMSSGFTNPNVYSNINAHATVVDTNNHFVYCLGGFDNAIDFGAGELEAAYLSGEPNLYLTKHDLSGNLIWAKSFYSSHGNVPGGMAIDNSGNLIVCGYSTADTVHFGSSFLVNGDPENGDHFLSYIAKLDGNGNTIWLKGSSNAGGGVHCMSVATDATGNIYATGTIDDPIGTFCGNNLIGGLFVIKLNASGNTQWFKQGNGLNFAVGNSITLDAAGNCIIAGSHVQPFDLGTFTVPFNVGSSFWDRFICKLNGSTGSYMWAIGEGIWQGPDVAYNLSSDSQNNIYVSGLENIAPDEMATTCYDYHFLEKRDANGVTMWHKTYRATAVNTISPTRLTDQVTNKNGETYALFMVNDTTDIGGTIVASSPANFSSSVLAVVAKLDTDGNVLWVKNTTDNSFLSFAAAYAITIDEAENIYYTGMFSGSMSFDQIIETTQDQNDHEFFLAKLGQNTLPLAVETKDLDSRLNVYPNPADKVITIDTKVDLLSISILDFSGREIYRGNSTSIDVSSIHSGLYLVSVSTSEGKFERRLIVQ